ncbi:hypothetical protein ABMA28_003644 [Loxostege sticticalis]|uniref:PiggyBac transposable element-derived protein domain-containing protein n=1 Tax=Loxostege sticticalis TaxID=481309 RepID=A0ABD0SWR3_LOXSC
MRCSVAMTRRNAAQRTNGASLLGKDEAHNLCEPEHLHKELAHVQEVLRRNGYKMPREMRRRREKGRAPEASRHSVHVPAYSVNKSLPLLTALLEIYVKKPASMGRSPEARLRTHVYFMILVTVSRANRELPFHRRHQPLRDEDISDLINYSSDNDSVNSDDDEVAIAVPVIPRGFLTFMETPLDSATADAEGVAEDPAAATTAVAGDPEPSDVPMTSTEQPWGPSFFDWRDFPNPLLSARMRREPFLVANVGPTTPEVDPYLIFTQIWDRPIMKHIAAETNRYAQQVASQMFASNNLHPHSRISQWHDTTPDELYVYFGLILAMRIVVKSRIEDYWSSNLDIFYTPGFSAHMSIDRFISLNKCVHFNNNEDMYMCAQDLDPSEARLFKIKPLLTHLNDKFQSLYTPAQNIALDESLLMWKGWLDFCQLIPNKAANRGIKTYEICKSQSGYLWRFEIHANKKSTRPQSDNPLEAATPAIVLKLIQGLQPGYTLWMDNFYLSPCLARRLKSLGFHCVGTLRTDRKFVPQALNNLTKRNMRPGQISGLTSGDVDVMVWRDTNRVAMISTYHGNAQQTLSESTKPILILDYNIMMGGVDKKDQLQKRLLNDSHNLLHDFNATPHISCIS